MCESSWEPEENLNEALLSYCKVFIFREFFLERRQFIRLSTYTNIYNNAKLTSLLRNIFFAIYYIILIYSF